MKSFFYSLLLAFGALILPTGAVNAQINCDNDGCFMVDGMIDLSTGVTNLNPGSIPIAPGALDPSWSITFSPLGVTDAFRLGNVPGGWFQGGQWISFDPSGIFPNQNTDEWFTFQRCFCNCTQDVLIEDLNVYASGTIREVRIDGVPLPGSQTLNNPRLPGAQDAFTPFVAPAWQDVGSRQFCIEVDVWIPQEMNPVTPVACLVTGNVQGIGLQSDQPGCCESNVEPEPGNIIVNKFHDINCDGERQSNEPPLAGWDFQLIDPNTQAIITTSTSNANGQAFFNNFSPGVHIIKEVIQAPWTPTTPIGGQLQTTIISGATTSVTFGNCIQEVPPPSDDCCDQDIEEAWNEDFEGFSFFSSNYSTGQLAMPGSYEVINSTQASALSNNGWVVQGFDASGTCSPTANFLAINGRTGQTGDNMVYRSSNLNGSLVAGREYQVCVRVKQLDQCVFNVTPVVRVNIFKPLGSNTVFQTPATTINAGGGNCDYQTITGTFTHPGGGALNPTNLTITLDETGIGDGNDFVVDDISIREVAPTPNSLASFGGGFSILNNGLISVFAATQTLPADCEGRWEICEVDNNGNYINCLSDPNWGTFTTFPGYNGGSPNGTFFGGTLYRIFRYVKCDCESETVQSGSVGDTESESGTIESTPYEEGQGEDAPLIELTSGGTPLSGQSLNLKTSPNPFSDFFLIDLPTDHKAGNFEIFDLNGRMIKKVNYTRDDHQLSIDLSSAPSGTYLLKTVIQDKLKVIKLIKQ
ncbi:T9SS type A sorting domain-containing protein [Lewinella cohaerens]|uniref:T9SS type A sorting domain-containing protein n=1 Tax=Lewinella cohaerens TaxID=70995 RepID=UPI0003767312|nr:T9SS type A sorting domain-containing protein [Lewinella cohaerens]